MVPLPGEDQELTGGSAETATRSNSQDVESNPLPAQLILFQPRNLECSLLTMWHATWTLRFSWLRYERPVYAEIRVYNSSDTVLVVGS